MKNDDTVYVIFRRYSNKESIGHGAHAMSIGSMFRDNITHLYGWTPSKATVKAFLGQRNRKKYIYSEIDSETLDMMLSTIRSRDDLMIRAAKFRSRQFDMDYQLFLTNEEEVMIRQRIRNMFTELSSLDSLWREDNYNGALTDFVNMIINLMPRYAWALHYIGYRPKEIDAIYDSVEDEYDEFYVPDTPPINITYHAPGESFDLITGIIYSLESAIMVIRDDL